MLVAFSTDIHICDFTQGARPWHGTLSTRARECLATLRRICEQAYQSGCKVLVIHGDLTNRDNPALQLMARIRHIFDEYGEKGLKIVLGKGNHDISTELEFDNSNAVLAGDINNVFVAEPDYLDDASKTLVVSYRGGDPMKYLPDVLAKYSGKANTAAVHMGLSTDRTAFWLAASTGAIKGQPNSRPKSWCTYHTDRCWGSLAPKCRVEILHTLSSRRESAKVITQGQGWPISLVQV